jgi:hypothetical protein
MKLIYVAFVLQLMLLTSAQCQQTAEDWSNKGDALDDRASMTKPSRPMTRPSG